MALAVFVGSARQAFGSMESIGASKWLLKRGIATPRDTIEVWREGRGKPDYILQHATIGAVLDSEDEQLFEQPAQERIKELS